VHTGGRPVNIDITTQPGLRSLASPLRHHRQDAWGYTTSKLTRRWPRRICAATCTCPPVGCACCQAATAADASSRRGRRDSATSTSRAAGASPYRGVPRRRCPGRRRVRAGHRRAYLLTACLEPDVDNPGHQGCRVARVRRELTTRNDAGTRCHGGMRVSGGAVALPRLGRGRDSVSQRGGPVRARALARRTRHGRGHAVASPR
jgi:hypothetical protein